MPQCSDLSCFYDDESDDYNITIMVFFTAFATLKVFSNLSFSQQPYQAGREDIIHPFIDDET